VCSSDLDDNTTNLQVATAILRKLGYNADTAVDGTGALEALSSKPYGMVLMDVQMPEMDGFEATRQIRSLHSRTLDHRIPVVAMTARAMRGDREKCLEAGMNDYITKPVSPEALRGVIDRWMPPGRVAAGSQPAPVQQPATPDAGPPNLASTRVFDRYGMLERLMGDEDLAWTIVSGFLEDMPRQIMALRNLVSQSDPRSAGGQAHKIKGAAANVGGEALRSVAAEMEKSGKAGNLDEVAVSMPKLEHEYRRLRDAIATWEAETRKGNQ
jgi:CheY-like chemotaxis protein/HPt (histidine-containing phosphotransfer) domain-containing protein